MRTKQKPFSAFGQLLREARAGRKWTQGDLAKRLGVGQQAVSGWERGASRPETKTLVRQLSGLFKEHELAEWLRVTGYETPASSTAPAKSEQPVRPALEVLPFDQLSFEQFQGFCALLLTLKYGDSATVNQFGVAGDAQDGIDIEVRFHNGKYDVYQCKREKTFGPEKIKRAVKKLKAKCDRATILLSRPATAAARKAIPTAGKWSLQDALDIATEIRSLPLPKQRRLIDTYFRAYRKDFLGLDQVGAFDSPDDHFAPLNQRDHVFSHAWTLVGRDLEIERLSALVERPAREVTLLVGAGGIGKSRLVLEICRIYAKKHPDRGVFVLSANRVPSAQDYDELSEQPALLIIEDAHEHAQLGTILATLARLKTAVSIVVATRPYAAQAIRSELSKHGLLADDQGTVSLAALNLDQAESVSREILLDRKGPADLAKAVARLTRGSSLALVVGSHLVATRRIHPSSLNNEARFRDELFGRFRDALTGSIGPASDQEAIRDTLNLVALVQPIDPGSPVVNLLADNVLRLRPDKVKRAIDLLHRAGVLVERGRMLRIAPDLLAEYILEDALRANEQTSGFLEQTLPHCDQELLANVLLNVSRLDWRLNDADQNQSRLADSAWKHVDALFFSASGAQDTIVAAVARAAFYQPARAITFYDRLRSYGYVHQDLPMLLKRVSMNFEHIEEGAARLWELGSGDQRPLNQYPNHPLRVLNELAHVEPGKPADFCQRFTRFAIDLIKTGRGGVGEHSAFAILRAALATEGHTTESKGHSFSMTPYSVRQRRVSAMRAEIVEFLISQLSSGDIRIAVQAASTLSDAVRWPHGLLGRVVTDEERSTWSAEFCGTLQKIRAVAQLGKIDPFVAIELRRSIDWHSKYAPEPTLSEAKAILAAIPQTLSYRVSLAMADGWGHLELDRSEGVRKAMDAWNDELKRLAADLVATFPIATDTIAFLCERLHLLEITQSAVRASPGVFLQILAEVDPRIATGICKTVVADPRSSLRQVFGESLYRCAMTDPAAGAELAAAALASGDVTLARITANAYSNRLRIGKDVQPSELLIAERLLTHEDGGVVSTIVRGISAQSTADRSWAIATLLQAPIERLAGVADEVCGVFESIGDLATESLDAATIEVMLKKLEVCPSIEGHWIQEFLGAASKVVPAAVLQTLFKRIEIDSDESSDSFQALPYLWGEERSGLNFRETNDFRMHLRAVREWLLGAPRSHATRFWGGKLYAAVAGRYDELVVADLEEWTRDGDERKFEVIGRVLAESGREFSFTNVSFVTELLERASAVSDACVQNLRSSLWGAAMSGTRQGTPGEPFPEDIDQLKSSTEILATIPRTSPAWPLFDSLRKTAEQDIQSKRAQDEELFDDA